MDPTEVLETTDSILQHVGNIEQALESESDVRDIYIRNQLGHIRINLNDLQREFDPHSPVDERG